MNELKLLPCPVCKNVPNIGYACGDYFVSGYDPKCPGCGYAFTEMHSSEKAEIEAWNRRVTHWMPLPEQPKMDGGENNAAD